jgi:CheY-like chemotaxis protein
VTDSPPPTLRILLIEDEAAVRDVLAAMLTSLGYSVQQASNGREGLARLEAGEPVDVILTDLRMPGMSGEAVVRAVKARWPHLPVCVMTGTPEHVEPRTTSTANAVILKPITLDALQDAIDSVRRRP